LIIIGVRFKDVGRIYYFDPVDFDPPLNAAVIVETVRGAEYGIISLTRRDADVSNLQPPIRKMLRLATPEDEAQEISNRTRETEARAICAEKIKAHGLEMHLVDVELTFDLSKIIFYFTADGRVDFRELVKDLAATFRTRIELRQIGARDEAKIVNGVGICGRNICCASFLDEFQPVSVKTAKDQGLGLNPTKISGVCGKLMCCLKYEESTYIELNKNLPNVGDKVQTPDGVGEVLNVQVLRQTVKVAVQKKDKNEVETDFYPVEEIKIQSRRPPCGQNCSCGGCKKKNDDKKAEDKTHEKN